MLIPMSCHHFGFFGKAFLKKKQMLANTYHQRVFSRR